MHMQANTSQRIRRRRLCKKASAAVKLAEQVIKASDPFHTKGDHALKANSYLLLGRAHQSKKQLPQSREAFQKAKDISDRFDLPELKTQAEGALTTVDSLIEQVISHTPIVIPGTDTGAAETGGSGCQGIPDPGPGHYEERGSYAKSIEHYTAAVLRYKAIGGNSGGVKVSGEDCGPENAFGESGESPGRI